MIADLLQKKQSAAADAAADQKDAIEKKNAAILAQAKDDFAKLFGDINDELHALRQPGTGFNTGVDGVINSVSLIVQSDELSLSPMSFDWSSNGKIYCKVKDGNGNFVKSFDFSYPNVTLADALYCANQHFPEWKKRREEKITCIRNQRVGELLDRRNWETQDAHTANETYRQLKEIDPDMAERRLHQWKDDVIREYSDYLSSHTAPEHRYAAIRWRDCLGAADPELADELFAKWEENAKAHAARQAEKERENALKERERAAYVTAMTQWRADLKEWAKKETTRMWKPFSVTYVRYVPIGYAGSTDEDIDVIQGVYCIGTLEEVVAKAMEPGAILEVYDCGAIKKKAIGAFLDAETAATYTTEPPAIDSYVRFSKEFYVGGVCINMPPFTTEQPTGCPVRPVSPDGTSDDSDEINF